MRKSKSKKVNVKKLFKIRLENTETRYKNKKGFRPTEQQAYQWFRVINRALFNSRLPMVPLHVRKLHKDWGRCVANWDNRKTRKGKFDQRVIPYHIEVDYFIELHCKFPKWKDFIETLAHEMVHLYQMTWLQDPYSNHNKNFFAWRTKFQRAGLSLTRC
tara:strand:+ start:57 stop:533 length:477 start_codon:yes stop_codon:yes gene_type:complete